jgi:hypothetical protein
MKQYVNLTITSTKENLILLLEKLKSSSSNKWSLEKNFTKEYSMNISRDEKEVACFRAGSNKDFGARISLVINDEALKVTNIVPQKSQLLDLVNYNRILNDFYSGFVLKHIDSNIFLVKLTSEDQTIEDLANKETAKALIAWEGLCNRSSGIGHPYDEERWFQFIIEYVRTNSELTPNDLRRWLIEEKCWYFDEDYNVVDELISYFEYGRDLLKYYVKKN